MLSRYAIVAVSALLLSTEAAFISHATGRSSCTRHNHYDHDQRFVAISADASAVTEEDQSQVSSPPAPLSSSSSLKTGVGDWEEMMGNYILRPVRVTTFVCTF